MSVYGLSARVSTHVVANFLNTRLQEIQNLSICSVGKMNQVLTNVMTILCDFDEISETKMAIFLKTNVMTIFYCINGYNLNQIRFLFL
jgi:hypothetical protein